MHTKTPPRTLACVMVTMALVVSVGCNLLFGPILGSGILQSRPRDESIWPTPHERAMRPYMNAMLSAVPSEGTVAASFQFLPALANRASVHSWHHILAGHYSVSRKAYDPPTDAVALIANLADARALSFMREPSGRLARAFLEANGLAPVEAAGDVVLFRKDVALPVKLYETGDFTPTHRLRSEYNGQLTFLGTDELPPTTRIGGTLPVQSFWRRVGRADRFYLVQFLLIDEYGRPVLTHHRHICYSLYPVHDWAGGAVVRETYNLVVPTDVTPGRYTVGLRVLEKVGRMVQVAPVEDPELRRRGGVIPLGTVEVLPAGK